jgi:hypothetical protein
MPRLMTLLAVFMLVLLVATTVLAQDDCPLFVESALLATETLCGETGRNEACYGNINLEAEPQPGIETFTFETPGDKTDLTTIQTLRLESLNLDAGLWGIALMRIQANLPDTGTENVTMLLFGNVELEAVNPTIVYPATIVGSDVVNVRIAPSVNAPAITTLQGGTAVVTTGRNEDSTWVRVRLPDSEDGGWIATELVTFQEGSVGDLEVVDRDLYTPDYGPMQAFIFRSGVDDSPCEGAPDSGILVQTPEGVGEVSLLINEVDIRLSSTAYLSAGLDTSGNRRIAVQMLEGEARIESEGVAQYLRAGQSLTVPLNDDGTAEGQPSQSERWDGRQESLPITPLEREIEIAAPYEPNPSAPVIRRIEISELPDDSTRENIFYTDLEGDASTLEIELVEVSDRRVAFQFEDTQINTSAEEQQAEAMLSRQTICTEGTQGTEALFRITIEDTTGLESNIVEYRITCGGFQE